MWRLTAHGKLLTFARTLRRASSVPGAGRAGWPPPFMSPAIGPSEACGFRWANGSSFTSLRGPPGSPSPGSSVRAPPSRAGASAGPIAAFLAEAHRRLRATEERQPRCLQRRAGAGCGAHGRRRGAQDPRPSRASATPPLTHRGCLSRESAANAASYAMGPRGRAPQGSRSAAETAEDKRYSQPQPAFARVQVCLQSAARTTAHCR